MKLSRKDILDTIKVLSHYSTLESSSVSLVDVDVKNLCDIFESYFLSPSDDTSEGELSHWYDNNSYSDDDEIESSDDHDNNDSSEEEDDLLSSFDDEEDESKRSELIDCDSLHDLKPLAVKSSNTNAWWKDNQILIEFQQSADDENICELLVDGNAIGDVVKLYRNENKINVCVQIDDKHVWHQFVTVKRLSKEWSQLLSGNVTYATVEIS